MVAMGNGPYLSHGDTNGSEPSFLDGSSPLQTFSTGLLPCDHTSGGETGASRGYKAVVYMYVLWLDKEKNDPELRVGPA